MSLVAASTFDVPALTALFNAGFSGYPVPMHLTQDGFRDHVSHYDIDLDCSRVVVDESPAAFALVGRRGAAAWIGGMGTVPTYRRHGFGEAALVAAIEAAAAAGSLEIRLEVIDANEPAVRLYDKLGFTAVRDLLVWSLSPAGKDGRATVSVKARQAQGWIAAHRQYAEPWQRADETLASLRRRGAYLDGLVVERQGEVIAAAVIREWLEKVSVMQIAATDEATAADVLLAAGASRPLHLANVPRDEPASRAAQSLGASCLAVQHEMVLRP